MSTDLTHIALEAADWLDSHEWIQRGWGDDTKGCMHQALRVCDPQPGNGYLVSAVLSAQGHSTDWNDETGRTKAEVQEYLRAITVTDTELAEVFGPNWPQVVVIVRQAAEVTEEQATSLDAAGAAAWAAAWAAAGAAGAAGTAGAAGDAAGDAAWAAAGDAAWDAAWAAAAGAWAAAAACAVRDLITPEQFQTLAGPWIAVMGDPSEVAS